MALQSDSARSDPECSSSRLCPRYSRQPAGIDRVTLWYPTFSPSSWTSREIRQDGNPEALLHLIVRGTQAGLDFNPSRMAEQVKRFETLSLQLILAISSVAGGLIHATSGSTGAWGGRCRKRMGFAA